MAQFNSKSSRVYCKLPVARLPKSVIIKQPGQIKSAPFKKAKTPKSAQPQKNENNPSHDSRLNEKCNKANQLKTTTNLNNVNKHMKIEETWDNSCTLESKLSKSFQKSYYVETVKLKIKNGKIGREKKGSVFLVAKNNKSGYKKQHLNLFKVIFC